MAKKAQLVSVAAERACKVILPPKTKLETARRAVEKAVVRWIEQLEGQLHLRLVTDLHIQGPFFCPFLENYGEDMWIASGRFSSEAPRLVAEDVVVGARRMAEDAGMDYERFRSAPEKALPSDMRSQLKFVAENPDQVYDDLREVERKKHEADPKDDSDDKGV